LSQFCGPSGADHFFCHFTPLLELSRRDTVTLTLFPFLPCVLELILLPVHMVILHGHQISVGRQKAFCSCSSHLTGGTAFYDTLIPVGLMPRTPFLRQYDKTLFPHRPHSPAPSPHPQPEDQKGCREADAEKMLRKAESRREIPPESWPWRKKSFLLLLNRP